MGKTGEDEPGYAFDKIGSLCQDDLQEIKQEILSPKSPVPLGLKKLVSDIDVEEKST